MAGSHERFEEFALGHVLGGLPQADATMFRAHLVECRDCRMRVAELRDIAADLAVAEREERRLAAVATQVAQSEDDGDRDERSWLTLPPRWAQVAAVVGLVAVVGILFWNYHLRKVATEYARTVREQTDVLDVLARGDAAPLDTSEGVDGVAAVHRGEVAIDLDDLPPIARDQQLVAWLLVDGQPVGSPFALGVPVAEAPLAFALPAGGADELRVTVEPRSAVPPGAPGDRALASVAIAD